MTWEATGIILSLITALVPLSKWTITAGMKYIDDKIKEYDEDNKKYFENLFTEYYYPLDSQIKHIRQTVKDVQQQALQLNRLTQQNILELKQQIKKLSED